MTAIACARCERLLHQDILIEAEAEGLECTLCKECAEGVTDMATGFAGALDYWADVTGAVLNEWAILLQTPVSNEVRATEVGRPIEVVRADMLRVASSGDRKSTTYDVYGLRMLALLLTEIAGEAEADNGLVASD
jgi:hypothetical protein